MRKARLLKLADHLDKGKLIHKEFYFGKYNDGPLQNIGKIKNCGTRGCAIGECPAVFPEHWKFADSFDPILKNSETGSPVEDAEYFFDIDYNEYSHLFLPTCQHTQKFGGKSTDDTTTRKQVASNIRAFVKRMSQ